MGIYMRSEYNGLCFTANTAGSTIALVKNGNPTSVTIEESTDGTTWSTYSIGYSRTLTNVGDKIYFRNASETDTRFSTGLSDYYNFSMTGSISASGDVMYLLNKNGTTSASAYCFCYLFRSNTALTSSPKITATSLKIYSFESMFHSCTNLTTLPKLYATYINDYGYERMFYKCTNIKLSTTQTGDYQTAYTIPTSGTGSIGTSALNLMFTSTGGTFTGTPSTNTTYYTSNTVV